MENRMHIKPKIRDTDPIYRIVKEVMVILQFK